MARFYDLTHENETGFSFLLESIEGIAQYLTETGFCFAIANQRGKLCLDLMRISCGVGRLRLTNSRAVGRKGEKASALPTL
ncbi:hypothetical protein GBC03_11535 [Citrobacter telavivensis]|uniref:Uncharacterized protein n=1 Tax=Citrobacter telavivensis TaxID=2653932 RepID=A0A6L5EB60_9ENTR|nr:hypothetical protein [Citrobacter telavivensis]QFS70793.1 hypothetical protein GBC03_11535 [Citrobacter telavivensis]